MVLSLNRANLHWSGTIVLWRLILISLEGTVITRSIRIELLLTVIEISIESKTNSFVKRSWTVTINFVTNMTISKSSHEMSDYGRLTGRILSRTRDEVSHLLNVVMKTKLALLEFQELSNSTMKSARRLILRSKLIFESIVGWKAIRICLQTIESPSSCRTCKMG